ncbi:ABC transporter permease [Cellulomonas dongxiuzhuiae]|uniref:ABC transporter permease subunit n=1 Tax=Cellulomonas dongxiuzhuiae TaxID=2819979 RepID=A0ABX8GIL0_9CELL|nr:ABC transporter permease subunit [Cellulomonas dongxiuzhuiae]MBO3089201.1 ABC transporter permease subunit [Cellulomonas dongxiuzhuiae]MBO3095018.1 ABC transporter permease subunit [Cellulomonas dongxiuzhuiae]QWC16034.1 ABC transporter permease subunit [Cellulomonas dongxiuzhuiae]
MTVVAPPGAVTGIASPPRRGRRAGGPTGLPSLVALVLLAAAWELTAFLSGGWVPSIGAILGSLPGVVTDPATLSNAGITLYRIAIAFVGATVIGSVLGIAMGYNRIVEAFFRPIVVIALAVPDPVYVIFAILVLGTEESSGIVALTLAVVPFAVTVVHSGVRARDVQLDELARVYRFSPLQYVTQVLVRQVAPALLVAARTSFAFSWKIVVLVEAMSQPLGIGSQIYTAFRLLRYDDMVATALVFIVVMRVVDALLLGTAERRALAWTRR